MIILGSGPNRIGQGIEFDYSCVRASLALHEVGYETVIGQLQPRDRLHRLRHLGPAVLRAAHPGGRAQGRAREAKAGPIAGVICQLGRQTPLGLAQGLEDAGVKIVGTSPSAIHLAEERGAFGHVLAEAGLNASTAWRPRFRRPRRSRPPSVTPCWCGRRTCLVAAAWRSCTTTSLHGYIQPATEISPEHRAGRPVHRRRGGDRRERLYDGETLYLGGVMEHIEEPASTPVTRRRAADHARPGGRSADPRSRRAIARGVVVRGLLNIQFASASTALRAGGQPAGEPHGSVRLQATADPAGQGRRPG